MKIKIELSLSKQNSCIYRTSVTFVDITLTGKYQVHVNLVAPLLLHTIYAHHQSLQLPFSVVAFFK